MTGASCGSRQLHLPPPSGNEATQSFDFWTFFTHSEHPHLHILLTTLVPCLLFHYVLIICLIFMHYLTQHVSTTIILDPTPSSNPPFLEPNDLPISFRSSQSVKSEWASYSLLSSKHVPERGKLAPLLSPSTILFSASSLCLSIQACQHPTTHR